MRITSFLFAAASILPAVYGAALPSEKDLAVRASSDVIVNAVKSVNTAVKNLDAAVKKVTSSDINLLLNVLTQANALTDTINTQQSKVKAAPQLDLLGALAVEGPTIDLVNSVDSLSKDLISIKKYVDQAGVTSVVLSNVQSQKQTADNFADVLTTKVPDLVQGIAKFHKGQIDDSLNKVIKAYSS